MDGYIHSFESFGTVDGPGIRFVIFMQGCPLRCSYCHNPDTWKMLDGKKFSSQQIVEEVKKYKNYFGDNGGVTISGGEPMLQREFLLDLCKELKKEKIHIAVDTSGFLLDGLEELINYVDLFLLDIKEIDDKKYFALTGKSNKTTLEFAKYLSDHNVDMWIRYVLVPSITDNLEDVHKLKEFLNTLKTVKKIEVLPYHTLGVKKYEELGIDYKLKGINPPTKEILKKVRDILHE